jgi:predicted PurR-regulated permease PerM
LALVDQRASKVIFTLLLFAAVLGFVWAAHRTLIAFIFAIFFAYLVDPLVEQVRARAKLSRGKAIAIVYVAIFLGLGILLFFVGPNIVQEAQKLANTLPDLYEKIASGQIVWQLGSQRGWSHETNLKIQQFLASHRDAIVSLATNFGHRLAETGKNAWWLVLIPILAVFFLKDGAKFSASMLEIVERRRQREFAEAVLNDVHVMLAHFIRAQLILAALTGVVFSIVLTVMRVPYGYIMGVIAGFLEFIPVVGPLVAALLIVGVAVGTAYKHIFVLIIFLAVWRGLQDYVSSPRIMGSHVELHPLAALFGILAGAEVAGVIGVYLSIPIMATLRIVWRRWQAYNARPAAAVSDGDLVSCSEPLRPQAVRQDRSA